MAMAMAAPQVFYQQNKGTLVPGQSISVNKYTVQVERYLSQGGFAHVYLVRTATPVYNTTHHVLKRIAVANEAMLTDVKKEVDIMRLLKGHPNIVHLIDAAWHRMSNGLYEVFILMEFCPGGGIIDMMNRRLRERLTEAEILQIFVDACEGVAYMHNSRPPLLHRDLKVENILQASPTSFKLCDFGSATTVAPRPPSNMQEIRALEDDLNRHTTLQYRAPEMIDAHLRRPIDEKSDVWALGVLLYKLCYYTTPFEEHGPLAILNVQYRIPPYPVYSSQMNALIASMLREHGTQRPTVFELLAQVHRLRGTKSQFQYRIPSPQPLSPRHQTQFKSPSPNPVQNTISYRQGSGIAASINSNSAAISASPSKNAGVQARDKVLEAIAPMRRGRPTTSKESPTSSRPPSQERNADSKGRNWLEDEEKAWEAVTAKSATPSKSGEGLDDAWAVGTNQGGKNSAKQGFGDDFGEQLWKAPDPNAQLRGTASNMLKPPSTAGPAMRFNPPVRPPLASRSSDSPTKSGLVIRGKEKDAFDGLGLPSNEKHAPTLAEARKLRTGLAVTSSKSPNMDSGRAENRRYNSSIPRPSPSPRPSYLSSPQIQPQSLSPTPALQPATSGSSWSSQPPPSRPSSSQRSPETLAAETRFPSLEELDASFDPGRGQSSISIRPGPGPLVASQPQLTKPQSSHSTKMSNVATSALPRSAVPSLGSFGNDGVRSEQVTGVAMRAGTSAPSFDASALESSKSLVPSTSSNVPLTRGSSIRRHRSSISMKPEKSSAVEPPASPAPSKKANVVPHEDTSTPRLPPRPSQRDWLTGDDDVSDLPPAADKRPAEPSQPVLRESPSKRASFIERSTIPIQEGVAVTHEHTLLSLAPPARSSTATAEAESPSRRAHRVFPELDTTVEPTQTLTDNWSPIAASPLQHPESRKDVDSTSSADEGPEDANRYVPPVESKKPRRKGRQSSVHDLVDLYGGGVNPEKKRERESVRSTVTPLPKQGGLERRRSLAASATSADTRQKSVSPQPAVSSSPSRPSGISPAEPSQQTLATSPPPKSSSSTSSSRSRPHSMFVFPSKPKDPSAPPSAGLSPPPEPEARVNTRRTSITDMVQRYEAIDAVARSSGSSAVSPKPSSLKVATSNENGTNSISLPPSKRTSRSISSSMPRASPISLTPQTSTSSTTSEEKPKEIDVSTPRPRRIPVKPDIPDSTRSSDPRSPSPEQPYQGVGKLIDQWQRKTAETAEATRTPVPKRGGFVAKRAGLVSGGNRG